MKNRVLRSALAVILVIAMVLTMAACGGDSSVDTTETPKTSAPATDKPVAPTDAPASVAPTAPPAVKDTVADDFGITLEAVDGVYGTKAKDADGDDMDGVYGYFKLTIDNDKIAKEQYKIIATVGGATIINTTTTPVTPLPSTISDSNFEYESETADAPATLAIEKVADKDIYYIKLAQAGEYGIEIEIEIIDAYEDFGAWSVDAGDKETFETTLSASAEVAKKQVEIAPDAIVVKAEDKVLDLSDAFAVQVNEYAEGKSDIDTTYSTFATIDTFFDATENLGNYALQYAAYAKEAKEGTYAVTVELAEGDAAVAVKDRDKAELSDFNDTLINHEVTGIVDTSIHALTDYDWNEVLDVLTTIGEIDYDDAAATKFAVADGNYKTQTELAIERYNSLSAEQQAFFKTGTLLQVDTNSADGTPAKVDFTDIYAWVEDGTESNDEKNADYFNTVETTNLEDNESLLLANAFVKYMEAAEDAVNDAVIVDAFDEVVKDAKLGDYFATKMDKGDDFIVANPSEAGVTYAVYNTKNASAISAYKTVESYFDGLSEDDQDVIKASSTLVEYTTGVTAVDGTSYYDAFVAAKYAFENEEITSVQGLIGGVYTTYLKAVENSKNIYDEATASEAISKWVYIDSNEVRSLTAQAKAAYDELNDGQKDVLDTETDYFNDLGVDDKVVVTNSSYAEVITKLADMNAMVDTMVKISDYINIEDFSADEKTYERLNDLVYGKYEGAPGSLFAGGYQDANDAESRYAMKDIIDAASRNYEAIITEYTAWIDFVLQVEDVKEDSVESFKSQVLDELDAMRDDLGAAKYDTYSAFDGGQAKVAVEGIKNETNVTITGQDAVQLAGIFFGPEFLDNTESIADVAEIIEEYTGNVDSLVGEYISYVDGFID